MRLSQNDIAVIRSLVHDRFGANTGIWLFGSRLDDAAQGGDIDLYIEPTAPTRGNLLLERLSLQRELERRLRQPVDLLVNSGRPTAFMRQARDEGRAL